MDSPGSDDERLREAAAGEAMVTQKMKILIIMLSLVLIVLLLPLASDYGLPLLRPMGISVLQRLWDAMRFIAMTAAISIGIISTSNSQKTKSFDGSTRHRSSSSIRRPSTPIINTNGSRESINPNMINSIQSAPYNMRWQNSASGDPRRGRSEEMGDSQKFKGKEVMNDLSFAASTSDASYNSSREGEIFELEISSSRQSAQSPLAPHNGEDHENFKQRPALKLNITNSRRRSSAGDIWFVPPRIDEEEEKDYISASAHDIHGDASSSTSRSRGESYVRKVDHLQKKASSKADHEKVESSNKDNIKISADRSSSSNVGTASMTDEYAELRMRRAAISRLGDDESGRDQRRSSSVDRRRPIKYDYDKQSPDQPGLKQILMDLSKERASKSKLSNLSSGSQAYNNVANQRLVDVRDGSNRPHPAQASFAAPVPSVQQTMKANVQQHQSSVVSTTNLLSESNQIMKSNAEVKNAAITKMRGSTHDGRMHHKPQEATEMASNQTLQNNQADVIKMGPAYKGQTPATQIVGHKQGSNLVLQADHARMGSGTQIVQKQVDAKVGSVQIVQNQGTDHHAKNIAASQQAPQKLVDAKIISSTQTDLHGKDNARTLLGSDQTSQRHPTRSDASTGSSVISEGVKQMQRRRNDAEGSVHIVQKSNQYQEEDPYRPAYDHKATTSKLLMQSSKHSRSALNLEQLEQRGNSNSVHGTRPTAIRSSARGKKSLSCDFGDGFNLDWILELEPPPPPGFFDQHSMSTDMTSSNPPTEVAQSDYTSKPPNPGLKNIASPAPVQSLVPWRPSTTNPIDISAYPRATSPASPPDTSSTPHSTTSPSPGEVNRRAEEFISNFNTRLVRQRQESLERQRRYG